MTIYKNQSPWGTPPGSGGSGNGGGFRRGPTPPNLDETIKKITRHYKQVYWRWHRRHKTNYIWINYISGDLGVKWLIQSFT